MCGVTGFGCNEHSQEKVKVQIEIAGVVERRNNDETIKWS